MAVPVTIGEWAAPMWVSWAGVIVAGGLSYFGLRFARARRAYNPGSNCIGAGMGSEIIIPIIIGCKWGL